MNRLEQEQHLEEIFCKIKEIQLKKGNDYANTDRLSNFKLAGDICGITSTIHHKCENKRCVNPQHLELVTHLENCKLYFDCDKMRYNVLKLRKLGFNTKEISIKLNYI